MTQDNSELKHVAEAVADGKPVDWPMTDSQILRRQLKTLEKVDRMRKIQSGHDMDRDQETPGMPGAAVVALDSMTHWKHLELRKLLGSGAYGEVYRAYDPNLQIEVALKLLQISRIGNVERCLEEARKHARVKHANVVTIHGADVEGDRVGIWMELIEGKTLEEIVQKNGPMGASEAADIGETVGCALAAVHKAGLVHGDVKAANVMRERGGRIILMDFSSSMERGTDDDVVTGTPLYIAPELLDGAAPTRAADVYSLGVLLYRLVSGAYPVEGSSLEDIADIHRKGQFVPLVERRPDLPLSFRRTVERSLATDPANRFNSVGAFVNELSEVGTRPRLATLIVSAIGIVALVALGAFGLDKVINVNRLGLDASLYRVVDGVDVELTPGSVIHPGDQLRLEVQASSEAHVYVLDQDEQGRAYLLFPMRGWDLENPLPGGSSHKLPGTLKGQMGSWVMDAVGGVETITVVASNAPLTGINDRLTASGEGHPVEIRVDDLRKITGIHVDPQPVSAPALETVVESLERKADAEKGLQIWRLRLRGEEK